MDVMKLSLPFCSFPPAASHDQNLSQHQHQEPPPHSLAFVVDFAAGGLAGCLSKTLVAPIERVKLLLQLQEASTQIRPERQYRGIVDCFLRVSREQGVRSLWRGNFTNLVRYFPSQALNFAFKDALKPLFLSNVHKDQFWRFFVGNLASGGAAGALTLSLVYPLDLARTRLGMDVGKGKSLLYTGMTNCLMTIYKSDGIGGLYLGFGVSIGGIMLHRAALFGGHDTLRSVLMDDPSQETLLKKGLIAQCASTLATLIAYPADTVRHRMMMQAGRRDVLYRNSWHCAKQIFRHENGLRGFFKGASSGIIRSVGSAFVLVVYEEIKYQ